MTSDDLELCKCLKSGEIAFFLSDYSKHGRSGKQRFLKQWIKSFIKQIKNTKTKNYIKKALLTHHDEKNILINWENHTSQIDHMLQTLKECSTLDDASRIKITFQKLEQLGYEVGIANLNEDSNLKRKQRKAVISTGSYSTLINQNIPENADFFIDITFDEPDEFLDMGIACIQDHGFEILDRHDKPHQTSFKLASAFNNPRIKLFDDREHSQ